MVCVRLRVAVEIVEGHTDRHSGNVRLILEGREDAGVDSGYDRYERPERWPSLPSRGVANEKAERLNEVEEQIPVDNENGYVGFGDRDQSGLTGQRRRRKLIESKIG
ncbi:PREDICTED: uncharacterized protein LOC108766834 isoform X3 [Trachymyrmex cornetzi]|uniref:uncharacterized protein LOC108766834 isoform X3 n=1 Tax=Trachymyrmex cornetzi TaxID=471704 RepID=UPI00084F53F9|nr:PREDICTED: uncharacterized protein LOC108766834 isoform X3 [Trachymyrmex cornetzi]